MAKTLTMMALTAIGFIGVRGFAADNGPARARIDATSMSCSSVQHAIQRAGSAVVYESADIYDKYVAHQGYCGAGERLETVWISAADTDQCAVSRCTNANNEGGN